MVTLAEMCLIARKKNKMTQAEFAKLVGSNQPEISYIEHGYISKNLKKVQAIKRLYQECMGGDTNGAVSTEKPTKRHGGLLQRLFPRLSRKAK